MGDLENLLALKKMLENNDNPDIQADKEKRFIGDAARAFLGEEAALKGYKPEDILEFLSHPSKEIQAKMGGEWLMMTADQFDLFSYNISKKIKKSASLIDWTS